jgi:hypothetical protein
MRFENSIKLAQINRRNGQISQRERAAALRAAQAAHVTYFDYLRAHVLLEAAEQQETVQNWWLQQTEFEA